MGVIRVSGALLCPPGREAEVAAALPEHVRLSRAEPGCLQFDLWQTADDPCRFELSEAFADRAAFEAHQARTRQSAWWALTAQMERRFVVTEDA